jgi:HAD superfamily hydrolase (TIGR01509 family)
MTIKAVIFDLDGTLVKCDLDFDRIKEEMGNIRGPILEHLEALPPGEKKRAEGILVRHELEAARTAVLNEGAPKLLDYLKQRGIKKGIVTRNSRRSVEIVRAKHGLDFEVVITREDAVRPKPSGEPLRLVLERLGLRNEEALFIGDYHFDMLSGKEAGVKTILLKEEEEVGWESDYRVKSLLEVIPIIEEYDRKRRNEDTD